MEFGAECDLQVQNTRILHINLETYEKRVYDISFLSLVVVFRVGYYFKSLHQVINVDKPCVGIDTTGPSEAFPLSD